MTVYADISYQIDAELSVALMCKLGDDYEGVAQAISTASAMADTIKDDEVRLGQFDRLSKVAQNHIDPWPKVEDPAQGDAIRKIEGLSLVLGNRARGLG